jgi:hypothetical protein
MNLKKPHMMTGDIANLDSVLLGVLRILRSNLENKPLLGERIICRESSDQPPLSGPGGMLV